MTLFKILLMVMGFCLSVQAKDHNGKTKNQEPDVPFGDMQTLTLESVESSLRHDLEEQISGDFKFELSRHPFPLEIIADEMVNPEVQDLKINDRKTRFTAKLVFTGFDAPPLNLAGSITTLTKVPTLNRPLSPHEVIQEQDIAWTLIPTRTINRSTITTPEQLIGAQARNSALQAETAIRTNDIHRAKSVKRGSLVTVVIKTASLHLETQAKALEDGEIGSIIKLINVDSQRVIQAKVIQANFVEALHSFTSYSKAN